ncbi:MAG: cysteine hydrolase [Oscillospiraceae bacterium]|nr:cysteine hydrolase [Oscillospiraceae bacterium]
MKALLVIDMQEAFVGKNHPKRFRYDDDIIAKVNSVIEQNDFVVYIRNLFKNNFINRLGPVKCFDGTPEAELAEGLKIVSENRFDKYAPSAFYNTELCGFLKKNGCNTVELVGVDVRDVTFTAVGALNLGFKATLNTSAIGTIYKSSRRYFYRMLREMGAEFI